MLLQPPQLGNENPESERAQARVYALWSFAQAYVAEKDRVVVEGGKGAEIRVRVSALWKSAPFSDRVEHIADDDNVVAILA